MGQAAGDGDMNMLTLKSARLRGRLTALGFAAGFAGALLIALPGALLAEEKPAAAPQAERSGKVIAVSIAAGKSRTIRTSSAFVDLVAGDSEIADVMPLNDRSLYVLGKKAGATSVSIYDADKKLTGVIEVEVTNNAPQTASDIRSHESGRRVSVSTHNGKTALSGETEDAVAATRAVRIARQYGTGVMNDMRVRRPQQVMLEVRFVEAQRSSGRELGVNWEVAGKNIAGSIGLGGFPTNATPFGAFLGRVLDSGIKADILIQALEERGVARRLAEPNLVAMSGESASFLAGGEFPVPVAAQAGQVTIEFKKFGVGLNFTPTVLQNGVINLRIEPEVSQLDMTNTIRAAGFNLPSLIVRRAATTVELRDGQSFAIAGLLQSVNSNTLNQLPWIADIPVLGALFRSASFQRKETDLAIIVTAKLVKPARPGDKLVTPADVASRTNDLEYFLLGKTEVPKIKRDPFQASAAPAAAAEPAKAAGSWFAPAGNSAINNLGADNAR